MGGHISRGGDCLCKGPVAGGSGLPSISSQEAYVARAQRPKGLVEAGGVARPSRTWGHAQFVDIYSK